MMRFARLLGIGIPFSLSAILICASTAIAGEITCKENVSKINHLSISSEYVSACIDSGSGNIGQSEKKDEFLKGKEGFLSLGQLGSFDVTDKSKTSTEGTFKIDEHLWDKYEELFIGFKFGAGNKSDNWFVYQLNDGVTKGDFVFYNYFKKGGGLSHTAVFAKNQKTPAKVPETGSTLLFLSLGLGSVGLISRRLRK
jgi:hypothetical protein